MESLRQQELIRFQEEFSWPHALEQYERLLERYLPGEVGRGDGLPRLGLVAMTISTAWIAAPTAPRNDG
jgi:hypothetical protein